MYLGDGAAEESLARSGETRDKMTDQMLLTICNGGNVSDYGESLTILPDSLGRPLAVRIRLLLARADREAHLAVLLRDKLHEVAGPDVASAIEVGS